MSIITYPLNGPTYDANDAAAYFSTRTSGVFSTDEDFSVTSDGSGLTVTVGAGRGWVHPERFVGYSVTQREDTTLTLPIADGQRPRIDRIVLRYDAAAHETRLQVLQGTPDTSPTAPAISRTALIYDLCLAEVTRPAASTTITASNIRDTRTDESLCGLVRDGVDGIPTDQLETEARERLAALNETASASAEAADASAKAAASYRDAAAEALSKTVRPTASDIATGQCFDLDSGGRVVFKSAENKGWYRATLPDGVCTIDVKTLVAAAVTTSLANPYVQIKSNAVVLLDDTGHAIYTAGGAPAYTFTDKYFETTILSDDLKNAKEILVQFVFQTKGVVGYPTVTFHKNRLDALEEKVAQGGGTGSTDIGLSIVDGKLCVTYDNGT